MRFTPYGSPSDKEIDALRTPPTCPLCSEPVLTYGDICECCQLEQIENEKDETNNPPSVLTTPPQLLPA
jgi:hypothetical protein